MTARTAVLVATAGMLAAALAQPAAEPAQTSLSVRAAVWGQVARPGQYYLQGSPDLFELLSQAGGPTASADLSRIVLIRERDGSRLRLNLGRIAESGKPFFIVPGDVVLVPESFWSSATRSLPVISTLTVIANLAVTMILLAQR